MWRAGTALTFICMLGSDDLLASQAKQYDIGLLGARGDTVITGQAIPAGRDWPNVAGVCVSLCAGQSVLMCGLLASLLVWYVLQHIEGCLCRDHPVPWCHPFRSTGSEPSSLATPVRYTYEKGMPVPSGAVAHCRSVL